MLPPLPPAVMEGGDSTPRSCRGTDPVLTGEPQLTDAAIGPSRRSLVCYLSIGMVCLHLEQGPVHVQIIETNTY